MTNKTTKLAIAVGCLGSLAATTAQAGLVEINVKAVAGTAMNSYAYSGSTLLNSSGWAGSWDCVVKPGGTAPLPAVGYTFTGFCTDIGNTMGNGTYTYEPLAFSPVAANTPDGVPPDPNWVDNMAGQKAAWIYNSKISSVVDANSRAAMCIAIWEALYEGSGDYNVKHRGTLASTDDNTGRTFMSTSSTAVQNLANSWLADGVAASWIGYNFTWFAEREGDSQGVGDVQSLAGPWNAVPEPSTYIAGALLLLPFGASTLRMLRKRRAA